MMTIKMNSLKNLIGRLRGFSPSQRLSFFLWVVALHSILVGILLIFHTPVLIKMIGFKAVHEPFFPCQGGVFHLIMSVAYIYGAIDIHKNRNMIIYAVIVKIAATLFLFSYYCFFERLWIIFLSGMIDCFMGAVTWGLLEQASIRSKTREAAAL